MLEISFVHSFRKYGVLTVYTPGIVQGIDRIVMDRKAKFLLS